MAESKSGDLHKIVTNGVRLAGDTMLVPGTSQLLDGQLGAGAVRAAAGIAARLSAARLAASSRRRSRASSAFESSMLSFWHTRQRSSAISLL